MECIYMEQLLARKASQHKMWNRQNNKKAALIEHSGHATLHD
jgi:hypothetical protein